MLAEKHKDSIMGTWGPGNLENDCTQDLIAEASEKIFREVIALLKNSASVEYDEIEYNLLFLKSERILSLAERGLINTSPEPSMLKPLMKTYVKEWYKYYSKHSGAEKIHVKNRKKVIENTFENLLKVANACQTGSFFHRISLVLEKMDES